MSIEGGRHTEAQAQAKWDAWKLKREKDPKSISWDMEGPNEEAPLQFRVKLSKRVDILNELGHEKELSSTAKLGKNTSAEELDRLREAATTNLDTVTGAEFQLDHEEFARKLASAKLGK
eukprot:8254100-Alexandrium_andersonii.AAC.1